MGDLMSGAALVATMRDRGTDIRLVTSPGSTTVDDVRVDDVVFDHRSARAGALFCCLRGSSADGHEHAAAAVAAGSPAILADRPIAVAVPQLVVDDARAAMAVAAAEVHGRPSESLDVIGVTGTNGKTTVTHMLAAILDAAERPAGVIGTLTGVRTTPEAPDLQRQLAAFRDAGRTTAAVEVSSQGLVQHRVDATRFAVAVFTNLSRDHLDYHGTMEAYFKAKARLFEPDLAALAVVNLDDPHGRLLLDAAQVPTIGYSIDDVEDLTLGLREASFTWRGAQVHLPLGGRFNVSNAVAAATVAAELGIEAQIIADGLSSVRTIAGRFEVVDIGAPFTVVVDFAHTPDGLEHVLSAAHEVAADGRVHVVFGCGGDKDTTKRPAMGEITARLADRVVVTSDNPRSEDPRAIIDEAVAGMARTDHVVIEPDRRKAIGRALEGAEPGDIVIVAGKGHEAFQEIAGEMLPFDDRQVVLEESARLRGGRP
jgi:UDP-N-acetylmuramoyl-L-alanyl-D-glutamate--2,6-diaminopimelate ligase